jgi:hypothetical protein
MNETASSTFLAELTAALTERGWSADPTVEIKVNLLTGGAGPRFADHTSPTAEQLRVRTRLQPGHTTIELDGADWNLDLTAAWSVSAALAAIDAAEADLEAAERGESDERTLQELLYAAGWASSLDHECRFGNEITWYSPGGTRRLRNDLTYPPTTAWILTVAPDFTENKFPTGDQDTPPAVIAALALTA